MWEASVTIKQHKNACSYVRTHAQCTPAPEHLAKGWWHRRAPGKEKDEKGVCGSYRYQTEAGNDETHKHIKPYTSATKDWKCIYDYTWKAKQVLKVGMERGWEGSTSTSTWILQRIRDMDLAQVLCCYLMMIVSSFPCTLWYGEGVGRIDFGFDMDPVEDPRHGSCTSALPSGSTEALYSHEPRRGGRRCTLSPAPPTR